MNVILFGLQWSWVSMCVYVCVCVCVCYYDQRQNMLLVVTYLLLRNVNTNNLAF